MSREFALLVRRWARERAGDDLEERGMSRTAAAFLRQAMCLLGTALHRAHAMRVHSAARDLAGLTPAGGRPGVILTIPGDGGTTAAAELPSKAP